MALGAPRELRGRSGAELGPVMTGSLQHEVPFTALRHRVHDRVIFQQCLSAQAFGHADLGFKVPLLADCVTVHRFLSSLAPL